MNTPRRKMGRVRVEKLRELAKSSGQTLLEALRDNLGNPAFKGSDAGGFVEICDELHRLAGELDVPGFVETALSVSGYEAYVRELGDMERFDNVCELKRVAREYVQGYGENVTLPMFLAHVALQTDDEFAAKRDGVKLMTIHAAKGLEFPAVFVVGMSEGAFPSARSIEERKAKGLEEERRLAYVAITRSERHLFVTESGGADSRGRPLRPSRFIVEMGVENCEHVGISAERLKRLCGVASRKAAPVPVLPKLAVGDRVVHKVFGPGRVQAVDDSRGSCRVRFEGIGQERALSQRFVTREIADASARRGRKEPEIATVRRVDELSAEKGEDGVDSPDQHEPQRRSSSHVVLPNKFRYTELTDDLAETNLWKRSDIPHGGWECIGITDLGKGGRTTCGMCGKQEIRYVHHMRHADCSLQVDAGCVCAGWMEGDPDAAKEREGELRRRAARRERFATRVWKTSKKGNDYLKVAGKNVVLFKTPAGKWRYSVDHEFSKKAYATRQEAALAAFDELEGR